VESLHFKQLKNDPLKPVLEIVPKHEKYGGKVRFVLHVVCPEKFKKVRFLPEKNNLRKSMISYDEDNGLVPTQHYNSSIAGDMFLRQNEEFLYEHIHSDAVKDAIILLKVWAKQKNFDNGYYGFD
jgi:U3 small nucleolar RNA-associated protein 22